MKRRIRNIGILLGLAVVYGCAAYHPLPLDDKSVQDGLQPPDMSDVRIRAGRFQHPLLPPVAFDDRDGLSPDEAAILAVIINPTLRADRDSHGIASAQLLQAGILPNPRLTYELKIPDRGESPDRITGSGFGLDWNIASLISRAARRDAAKAHVDAVDLQIAWREWQIAESARLHAFRLILARRRLIQTEQAEIYWHRLREDVAKGVEIGVQTQIDFAAVETRFQEARSRALEARSTVEQERIAFNRALGLPSRQVIPLEKDIAWRMKQHLSAESLFAHAETSRLDLLALKSGYESGEARVRAAIRSQFPGIQIGVSGDRDTDGLRTVGMSVSIDLPVFDRNQGRIAEARATRRQLFDEYIARLFEAHADIDQLVAGIEAAKRHLAVIDESLARSQTLADDLDHALDAGTVDLFSFARSMSYIYDRKIQRIDLEQRISDLGVALEIASGCYGLVDETKNPAQNSGRTAGLEMLE